VVGIADRGRGFAETGVPMVRFLEGPPAHTATAMPPSPRVAAMPLNSALLSVMEDTAVYGDSLSAAVSGQSEECAHAT
jgi:hypothetical protein